MKALPPQRALKFLRWFCREDYIEEIEGDLREIFEREYVTSPAKAGRTYTLNVLRYFRPEFIKSFKSNYHFNHTAMFRHNLLITYRNFLRYKSSFFINLIGLSSGLACALLIYLWVYDELHVDKFHENDSRLYQVKENVEQGGGMITRITTSGPTAEALAAEMPEVEKAVTASWISPYTLSVDENNIKANGIYATVDFFELFSFDLTQGSENQVLSDKKAIIISEGLSVKLFGTTQDAVGKMVEWQHEKQYQVSGVFRDLPARSSMQFDFVLSFEGFRDDNEWVTNWFNTAPQTYVLMKAGTDIDAFNGKIADLVRTKTEGRAIHRTPFVTRYSDSYLYGRYDNGVQAGGRIEYVRMFTLIAIFILLIACINFMNLSTARASRRIKEVGMKKAVGARQGTLIVQYLGESTLMTLLSLLVALLLVVLFLPQFNDITGKQLTLSLTSNLIMTLVCIMFITGLVSGSYPALYLSRFSPAVVLKGKLNNFIGEVWARKGLVVFQFTLSVILIVSVWVVYQQLVFVQKKNLGYEKDNIIILGRDGVLKDMEKTETFLAEVRNLPGVTEASSSGHDMTDHNGGTYGIEWPGKNPDDRTEFERMPANTGLIEMLGIQIKEGRTFSKELNTENNKIIFNEAAIEFMGMSDPLGKTVKLWGEEREIIGVVKDFHYESFHEKVKPVFFWYAPEHSWNIMIKMEAGKETETLAGLEQFYKNFNPGFPFDFRFLNADYQALYTAEQRVSTLSKYFAGLAVLISCLGLFGLASFTAERRIKEIGIRKILGSGVMGIVYLLTGDFTKMVIAAIVIALPASYFITAKWLETFAFSIDLEWWFFAGSGVIALLIAWLTVAFQTIKTARVNPSECLRNE